MLTNGDFSQDNVFLVLFILFYLYSPNQSAPAIAISNGIRSPSYLSRVTNGPATLSEKIKLSGLQKHKKTLILLCKWKCQSHRRKVELWVKDHNDRENRTETDKRLIFKFRVVSSNFSAFGIHGSSMKGRPHIAYLVDDEYFIYNNTLDKVNFDAFLDYYKRNEINDITVWQELEKIINLAQTCNGSKNLLLISDSNLCSNNTVDTFRKFYGLSKIHIYKLEMPLSGEMKVEINKRLPDFHSDYGCTSFILMHNNMYIQSYSYDLLEKINFMLHNNDCSMKTTDWNRINDQLTDVGREFYIGENMLYDLEWRPSYIMVGSTGGIAVIALAISIFWGLNGSAFVAK